MKSTAKTPSKHIQVTPRAVANHFAKARRFYEQVTREGRVLAYLKMWIKWITVLIAAIISPSTFADLSLGFNPVGTYTTTLNAPPGSEQSTGASDYTMVPAAFGVGVQIPSSSSLPSNTYCNAAMFTMTTIDGYQGYLLKPGVLLVLTGTVTGDFSTNLTSVTNATGTWNAKGIYQQTPYTQPFLTSSCSGIAATSSPKNPQLSLGGKTAQIDVSYGVYISKDAEAGPVPSASLVLVKGSWHSGFRRSVSKTLTFANVMQTTCTVSTPSIVAFGDINQVSEDGVKQPVSVDVACVRGDNAATPVSIGVQAVTAGGSTYTLPLINQSSGSPSGDIRGYLGSSANDDAGCAVRESSVRMDGVRMPIGNVAAGVPLNTPLVWVLCPRVDAEPGQATAKATLEVTW